MSGVGSDPHDWIARLRLHGQGLRGGGLPTPEAAVGHLTAVQSQDHAYARWSVAQRTTGLPEASGVDAAFAEGRILRTHLLRPTWHYVAAHDLRWLIRLSGPRVDAANGRMYRQWDLDAATLIRSNDVIAQATAGGDRTRRELAASLEAHGLSTTGERLTYMLMHAELTAVICSGPLRGKEHTYAAFDHRVPPGLDLEGDAALAELAWRYFSTRGPATLQDFSWWSGIRMAEARQALAMVGARLTSHTHGRHTYWFCEASVAESKPRIDLLPCYDELIISYSVSRDVMQTPSARFPVLGYVDGYRHVLVLDGRLLGHWRVHVQRNEVRIEPRLSRALDAEEETALIDAADRYLHFAAQGDQGERLA